VDLLLTTSMRRRQSCVRLAFGTLFASSLLQRGEKDAAIYSAENGGLMVKSSQSSTAISQNIEPRERGWIKGEQNQM
jgi:hypothetical protein